MNGVQALNALRDEAFDLAIVDLGLPDIDGLMLIRCLRGEGGSLPILILSGRDRLQDCVGGLDAGADDYLVKPVRLPELLARIRALVRRNRATTTDIFKWGQLSLDLAKRQGSIDGRAIELPGREWALLEALALKAPAVVTKERLAQAVGGWESDLSTNAIEVYVSRLRTKLDPLGIHIRTVRGIGYRLDEPAA